MAEQTKALTPYQQVALQMDKPETVKSLRDQLPSHISVEKFKKTALVALQKTPALAEADRQSLYLAINAAAQDGLLPDGREAALVTFGSKVQYMPMIAGILKKVRNSGELQTITAQTVHKKDEFSFWVDETGEHLMHKPDMMGDRGEFVGVYALAKTKDGGTYLEVMSKDKVEKIRKVSRAGSGGPWKDWFEEMAEKSALRALAKRLPMSTDILGRDDELFEPEPHVAEPVIAQPEAPAATSAPRAGSRTRDAVLDVPSDAIQSEPQQDTAKPGDLPI
jgi:recombination protein RecT